MSKYGNYAKELSDAFLKARKEYTDAYNGMKDAEAEYNASRQMLASQETYRGEKEQRMRRAELAYIDAKSNFEKVEASAWPGYKKTVEDLTKDLKMKLDKDSAINPDDIDDHGLKLLESGLINIDEYPAFIERYKNNPTMLRFIRKQANQEADNLRGSKGEADNMKRAQYISLADKAKTEAEQIGDTWDNLVKLGEIYGGMDKEHVDPGYVCRISERWDTGDNNPQMSVENWCADK